MKTYSSNKICISPKYRRGRGTFGEDIGLYSAWGFALIRLEKAVELSSQVHSACLPSRAHNEISNKFIQSYYIHPANKGILEEEKEMQRLILNRIYVDFLDSDICKKRMQMNLTHVFDRHLF